MTLGQRIQELRKQAGLSQEGLGEALGVSRQAVSKWEGDNGIPELDTLIAMSKLFGIPVGQLLGVETPEEAADQEEEKAPAGFTEEQVEEILRRYVEESRQHERSVRTSILARIVAMCCVAAVGIVGLISTSQIREMKQSVNTLWSNVADVESIVSNVRNQVGGLSDELRGVIEEQNSLVARNSCRLIGFDPVEETVTVELTAALKKWVPGTKARFVLDWRKTDDTIGQTISDWVDGPEFTAEVTLPMNYSMEITLCLQGSDGVLQEQPLEVIYNAMHEGIFMLHGANLAWALEIYSGHAHYIGNDCQISSGSPQLLWPVAAELTAVVNGEVRYQKELQIRKEADHVWRCKDPEGPQELKLNQDDELVLTLRITDNLGREHTQTEAYVAVQSGLDRKEMPAETN